MIKPLDQLRFLFRSRAQTMELAKTLVLVSILTVLIWVYAERAQNDSETFQVGLDVYVNNPSQFATLVEPINTPITAEIEGPRSKLDQLRTQLSRRIRVILPGTYEPDTETTVATIPVLNDYPEIRGLGVTVSSASPGSIKVRIDPKISRKIPLVLPENLSVAVSNVTFDPATVDVTGPQPLMNRLFPTKASGIAVDLTGAMDRINTPGVHKIDGVPLVIPREAGLQVVPQGPVSVKVEVSTREAEFTLRTLPIAIRQPLPTVGKWEVTLKEKTLTNIQVRGPASEIAKLQSVDGKPPEVTPVAVLKLTTADRGGTDLTREVMIEDLPPGVTPVDAAPRVEFSVKELGTPE